MGHDKSQDPSQKWVCVHQPLVDFERPIRKVGNVEGPLTPTPRVIRQDLILMRLDVGRYCLRKRDGITETKIHA